VPGPGEKKKPGDGAKKARLGQKKNGEKKRKKGTVGWRDHHQIQRRRADPRKINAQRFQETR